MYIYYVTLLSRNSEVRGVVGEEEEDEDEEKMSSGKKKKRSSFMVAFCASGFALVLKQFLFCFARHSIVL